MDAGPPRLSAYAVFVLNNGDISVCEWFVVPSRVCFVQKTVKYVSNSDFKSFHLGLSVSCCENVNRKCVVLKKNEKGEKSFSITNFLKKSCSNDQKEYCVTALSLSIFFKLMFFGSDVADLPPVCFPRNAAVMEFLKLAEPDTVSIINTKAALASSALLVWLMKSGCNEVMLTVGGRNADNDENDEINEMDSKVTNLAKTRHVRGNCREVNFCLIPGIPVLMFFLKTLILQAGDVERNPGPDLDDAQDARTDRVPDPGQAKAPVARRKKCDLQVVSLNVRGLGCGKKVRHLVNSCYKMSRNALGSIFMFQETFVPKLDLIRYLWRGEYHLAVGTGNSLGCITLVTAHYKAVHSVELGQ